MSVQTLGQCLFGIQFAALVYFCCFLPFRYVLRSGRFWRGVQFVWGSSAAFGFSSALLGQYLRLNVDKSLVDYCFEGPHVLAFAFMGWWSGMMVCSPALLIYRIRKSMGQKGEAGNRGAAAAGAHPSF